MQPDQLVARFERYAEEARQAWGTPGMAVALVADGQVIWSKGFGVKQAGNPEPVTVDTVFQIGSASKSFTASLVALQVQQGRLNWTDKVIDFFPDFRMFDPWVTREFTIEDTMSQRSGQAPYSSDLLAFMGATRSDILQAMREIRPVSSFRSHFGYVNNLWLAAAQVLENVSGKSWESQVDSGIFQPLRMTHSSTGSSALWKSPDHAVPHAGRKGSITPLLADWPFTEWIYTYGPAGGINSTVLDMALYVKMQLGLSGLLSSASLEKLHSPHILAGGSTKPSPQAIFEVGMASYCLGWLRQEMEPLPLVWHNGGTTGCKTVVGYCPEAGMGIVVLSNLGGTDLPEALMYRYYDLYFGRPDYDYSAAFLKNRPEAPAPPLRPQAPRPPAPLTEYVGSYRNPVYGVASVKLRGDGLVVELGKNLRLQLQPWDADTFRFDDPIDGEEFGFARFGGKFSELQLSLCEDALAGRFERVPDKPGKDSKPSPLESYLEGAEFQAEDEAQRKNFVQALNDALDLPPSQLQQRRYSDYQGHSGRWDLPTLFRKHLVPSRSGLSLGDNFFEELKQARVQKQLRALRERLRSPELLRQ